MPADHTQCRVRKQSDECESEKRLVKSQRSGDALTEYGARGALAGHALPPSTACGRKTALPSRENALIIFFGPELGLYQIRSPSPFARLHNSFAFTETRIDYFFRPGARTEPHMGDIFRIFLSTAERRLTADRSNQISVRVIATVGITRGRKTVLPSRNPCDSDPFSVARSQSSTSVAKLFAFREPIRSRFVFVTRSPSSNSVETHTIQIFCSRFCERASIRSPSGNHLHPPFSLAGGEPGRRGDHFWVRSRVELNLEALACHPKTTKERTRAPWNVFSFFSFFAFFSLYFFVFLSSLRI